MIVISADQLSKKFTVIRREKGLKGALSSLIHPEKITVNAVDNVSLKIEKGEIVGFIGPNGAGKSTTVKMMTGILHPTSGSVEINGLSPFKDRKKVVRELGVVFGQRTQLYWDLRLGESFELLKRIYQISDSMYKANMKQMDEVLGINEFIHIPVRQLSLGQRMRGELAAAMLHSPPVLFLDEPTIGLDVEGKHSIRKFIREINQRYGTTVILTTHDLDDVEQLCSRLIVINHGRIVEDGPLQDIAERMAPYRFLVLEIASPGIGIRHPLADTVRQNGNQVWLRFRKSEISASRLISDLCYSYPVLDLKIKEPDIEDMIRELYKLNDKTGSGVCN